MDKSLESAFQKIIPNYLETFRSTPELSKTLIFTIKREIKGELPDPNVSIYKKDIAKYILIYYMKKGLISNRYDFNQFCKEIGFIKDNLEGAELDALYDSLFSENEEEVELEEFSSYNQEYSQIHYLNDNPDWYIELGLKQNPFPSQDGLDILLEKRLRGIARQGNVI